ncbi:MAG: hypothetical protein V1487_01675 [bacterium]
MSLITEIVQSELLESNVNSSLQAWKNAVVKDKYYERQQKGRSFLDSLHALPANFKTIILRVQLDEQTQQSRSSTYRDNLPKLLGLSPVDETQSVFTIPILTPRPMPPMNIDYSHGSSVRDHYRSSGEIATVELDYEIDYATGDDTILQLNPKKIGAYSINTRLGVYRFFPRQIDEIRIAKDLPTYLNDSEISFVQRFYNKAVGLEE